MPPWTLPLLFGVLSGALGGLMGVGGGVILVPLLVRVLGRSQHEAHGTSLAFIVVTSLAAGASYLRAEHLDLVLAGQLAVGAVAGVWLGARIARGMTPRRLRQAFGTVLLAVAVRILALPPVPLPGGALWAAPAEVALGAGVGVLAGLLGVGGGTILVPVLVLLQRVDQHTAQGVSLLMIVPTAIVGAWRYARHGHIAPRLLPPLMAGGAAGALLGAALAHAIHAPLLSRLFALFLLPVAAQMIWSRAGGSATVRASTRPMGGTS
ncbi:MAG TPA: sulfite exporter TauE/SafE family protein [Candidatus Eisenbacteria bacterium]|jgi:uncharacterized membrane protein YfcA